MPRVIKTQLVVFATLTLTALVMLGWYYLQLPALLGVGQYTLYAELPRSGGLYASANVTYRGATIGKVTAVKPTRHGVRATMSISSTVKIPLDATANVHSVSAIGEQYLDLVASGNAKRYLADGQIITKTTVPSEVGPLLDATHRALAALPKEKIDSFLTEASRAVGGLGPSLQRLVDATTSIAQDVKDNLGSVDDIIDRSTPILDSQVKSGDAIARWSANLDSVTAQIAAHDEVLRSVLRQTAPTIDQVNAVFGGVRGTLPQTLANLSVVLDMLKRYHNGLEQVVVILPQLAAIGETVVTPFPGSAALDFALSINQPPPCLTGFLPASEWRSPADTSTAALLPAGTYCKIPQDTAANVVRGARNFPCVDLPEKRASTPQACRSTKPYVPLGTNPWYGNPDQIVTCPARAARCDQPVKPGLTEPAPSVDNGLNPLPADKLSPQPAPTNDPLTPPGRGSVICNGQQPNPCHYTPAPPPTAIYTPSNGEIVDADGTAYQLTSSAALGDDGWKQMLSPAG